MKQATQLYHTSRSAQYIHRWGNRDRVFGGSPSTGRTQTHFQFPSRNSSRGKVFFQERAKHMHLRNWHLCLLTMLEDCCCRPGSVEAMPHTPKGQVGSQPFFKRQLLCCILMKWWLQKLLENHEAGFSDWAAWLHKSRFSGAHVHIFKIKVIFFENLSF